MPILYYPLTFVYCLFLFSLSADSQLGTIQLPFNGADKMIHFTLYIGLTAIVSVGMRRSRKAYSPWVLCFIPILFATLYGISDELHQYRVPNRTCDAGDVLADMSGACFIQMILCYFWWRRPIAAPSKP